MKSDFLQVLRIFSRINVLSRPEFNGFVDRGAESHSLTRQGLRGLAVADQLNRFARPRILPGAGPAFLADDLDFANFALP